ncbi:MAG: methionine synthase [Halioglobus sp.]|nr:methionine synthase [Halioglobus sp.]
MSDKLNVEREADGVADSIAVVAIVAVVVCTLYLWLSGMPT